MGTLRTEKATTNSKIGIRKSEKQFVKTGSGALNSEKGIGESVKGAGSSWKGFGEGKTGHGKFHVQFSHQSAFIRVNLRLKIGSTTYIKMGSSSDYVPTLP